MAMEKPKDRRKLRPVPVDVRFDEMGGRLPVCIRYPLFAQNAPPEAFRQYREYKIQRVVDVRALADVELGITGTQYTVDVVASRSATVRTVLWFDEEKWYVEEKIKPVAAEV